MRHLVLAIFLLGSVLLGSVAPPVAAQTIDPARFTPLQPGNMWEYQVDQRKGTDSPGAFLRFEVEAADTTIENRTYGILHIEGFDAEMTRLYRRRCAFHAQAGYWPDIRPLGEDPAACHTLWPLPPPLYHETATGGAFDLQHQRVAVDATATFRQSLSGPGGSGASLQRFFAADIGVYRHDEEILGRKLAPMSPDHHWIASLVFAEVDGASYGTPVIATAREVSPRMPLKGKETVTVYPNPFGEEIFFTAPGLRPGPGRIELFDLAGRRVFTRETVLTQETMTLRTDPGPNGVYVLRITDGAGRSAVALTTRYGQRR